jgi:chromosome segregation ATPase
MFDDQQMIIKDSSGKEFIADVSPRPNQSSGYINQCNVASRMVECYNAMMLEYNDAHEVVRIKKALQVEVDVLNQKLNDSRKEVDVKRERINELCGKNSRLQIRIEEIDKQNDLSAQQIRTIEKELLDIQKELNKRNMKTSTIKAMVAEMLKKHFEYDFALGA